MQLIKLWMTYPCHEVSFVCRLALISPRGVQSGLIWEYYVMTNDWESMTNLVKFTSSGIKQNSHIIAMTINHFNTTIISRRCTCTVTLL